MSDDLHKLVHQAVDKGDWDTAIQHAKRIPASHDIWQQMPSMAAEGGMPNHAVHKVLDLISKPVSPHYENLPSFLFEYANNIPKHVDAQTLNRVANYGKDDYYVTKNVTEHPNYQPDKETSSMQKAHNFWRSYERTVEPHHFATVKSMFTGIPEQITDHRGKTGSSSDHMGVLPDLHQYAQSTQKHLLAEAMKGDDTLKIKHFKGQPHVKVYRGVVGHYADAIRKAANMNDDTAEVDKKLLKLPVTHLASWTTDPVTASTFANRSIPGHPVNRGLVIEKWLPLKHVLHSGYHTMYPDQNHAHPGESELVFGAPEGHVKIPTSGIHVVANPTQWEAPKLAQAKVRPHTDHPSASKVIHVQVTPSSPTQGESMGKMEPMEMGPMYKAEDNLSSDEDFEVAQAMAGVAPHLHSAFEAARFLAARPLVSLDQARRALWSQDGSFEEAALEAYGIPVNEANLKALRAVMSTESLDKAEPKVDMPDEVEPGVPEATETSRKVWRAYKGKQVQHVRLGGKHSAGSMLAKDPESGEVLLLKPGSGGQSPSSGLDQDPSTQSQREVAFSKVAEQWGLKDYVPHADLILIDSKPYAAIHLLAYTYKSVEKQKDVQQHVVLDSLNQYRVEGILHKWAMLDFVLGSADRHAGNIMINNDGKIRLIDHGSSFAGMDFDPAHDENSFVPYYLRAWSSGVKFNKLSAKEKLARMPTMSPNARPGFNAWVESIDKDKLAAVLQEYGIDPKPSLIRLARIQGSAGSAHLDDVINKCWAST